MNLITFYSFILQVSQNGYISLGSDPQIQAQPLANFSFSKKVVILAPFWAELDLSSKGKIFVDNYKNCTLNDKKKLSEIGKGFKNFQPRRALVITWKNVSPYPASEFGNEASLSVLFFSFIFITLFNIKTQVMLFNDLIRSRF